MDSVAGFLFSLHNFLRSDTQRELAISTYSTPSKISRVRLISPACLGLRNRVFEGILDGTGSEGARASTDRHCGGGD